MTRKHGPAVIASPSVERLNWNRQIRLAIGNIGLASVEISGEAFSAFGMRKGNLISCKARVEIKARRANGDIIAVDRQTSVAVDVAGQTAAKTALQNAATELAERLVPKLVK